MINLGTLLLNVKAQTKEADASLKDFQEIIKNTEMTGKDKFKALGVTIKKFGKAAAIGIAATVGAALVKITKDAVKAYGEFEQLQGGVEKIFGDSYQQIMDDAEEAYHSMGLSANQYLDSIIQIGAQLKGSGLGDKEAYETAKTMMQSVSDFASGTGRNVDELNEKVKMISRSTSSYQSIADQFAGMLPATSAAFLEQAQAAGFLSDEYTALTQVPMDEYQQALSKMMEKGVEDLGLLGNTAMEASETLTGSMAQMEAAYENFVTALGTGDDAKIDEAMNNLTESISTYLENLIPLVLEIVMNLLGELLRLIGEWGVQLLDKIGAWLEGAWQSISAWFTDMGQRFVNWFVLLGQKISTNAQEIWNNITAWFADMGQRFVDWWRLLFTKIKTNGINIWNKFKTSIINIVQNIKKKFIEIWNKILEKVKSTSAFQTAQSVINKVSSAFESLRNWIKSVCNWWDTLRKKASKVINFHVNSKAEDAGGLGMPKHWIGKDEVPYDNYRALLHKGEKVLTAAEANQYDKLMSSINNSIQDSDTPRGATPQTVVLNVDGKEFARFIAPLMNKEIQVRTNRSQRLQGVI